MGDLVKAARRATSIADPTKRGETFEKLARTALELEGRMLFEGPAVRDSVAKWSAQAADAFREAGDTPSERRNLERAIHNTVRREPGELLAEIVGTRAFGKAGLGNSSTSEKSRGDTSNPSAHRGQERPT